MREVVIVAARRTPMGSFQGALSSVPAITLGGVAIQACLERSGVPAEPSMRCSWAWSWPQRWSGAARQAALAAGLPQGVPCTTVNKVCGSGLRTVMFGAVDRRWR